MTFHIICNPEALFRCIRNDGAHYDGALYSNRITINTTRSGTTTQAGPTGRQSCVELGICPRPLGCHLANKGMLINLLSHPKILTFSSHRQTWPKDAGRHWTSQPLHALTLSNRLAAENMTFDILRDEISFLTDEEHAAASTRSLTGNGQWSMALTNCVLVVCLCLQGNFHKILLYHFSHAAQCSLSSTTCSSPSNAFSCCFPRSDGPRRSLTIYPALGYQYGVGNLGSM